MLEPAEFLIICLILGFIKFMRVLNRHDKEFEEEVKLQNNLYEKRNQIRGDSDHSKKDF